MSKKISGALKSLIKEIEYWKSFNPERVLDDMARVHPQNYYKAIEIIRAREERRGRKSK